MTSGSVVPFVPGTDWRYSNTNYAVAGLLVQQLTGTTYAEQVAQRILMPLGLRDTVLPGGDFAVPDPHAHGYELAPVPGSDTRLTVDMTMINPTSAWAAGEIISTTADLDEFIRALLDGRLLPPQELAAMPSFRQVSPSFLQ
jgi:D-alanyl-D-alanine carboxypeptidase